MKPGHRQLKYVIFMSLKHGGQKTKSPIKCLVAQVRVTIEILRCAQNDTRSNIGMTPKSLST